MNELKFLELHGDRVAYRDEGNGKLPRSERRVLHAGSAGQPNYRASYSNRSGGQHAPPLRPPRPGIGSAAATITAGASEPPRSQPRGRGRTRSSTAPPAGFFPYDPLVRIDNTQERLRHNHTTANARPKERAPLPGSVVGVTLTDMGGIMGPGVTSRGHDGARYFGPGAVERTSVAERIPVAGHGDDADHHHPVYGAGPGATARIPHRCADPRGDGAAARWHRLPHHWARPHHECRKRSVLQRTAPTVYRADAGDPHEAHRGKLAQTQVGIRAGQDNDERYHRRGSAAACRYDRPCQYIPTIPL